MPGLADVPGVEIHGKGTQSFTLPVGHVGSDGKVHNSILLREMTGAEDDIMGQDELPVGERVSQVLSACITKLGEVTDLTTIREAVSDELKSGLPLTEQDRIAAMIFLRRITVADLYKFSRTCPRCGEPQKNRALDLRTIEIKKAADPLKRRVKLTLPRSGQEAVVRVLTAKGSIAMGKNLTPTSDNLKSLVLLARTESIGGKRLDDPTVGLQVIQALPQADRNLLRQVQNAMEAFVDTDVDVKCKNPVCGNAWSFNLDVGQSFFLDTEGEVEASKLNWL